MVARESLVTPVKLRTGPRYPLDPLVAFAMFEQGKDPANVSLRRLVKRLTKAGIAHAVVGGLAVYVHGHRRMTVDVDVLMTPAGLAEFRKQFVPKDYAPTPGRERRFVDRKNNVTLDILITGGVPGWGQKTPIRFPDPEQVRVLIGSIHYVDLTNLIQLKLAARRYQDFADVVKLIEVHNLDESFLDRLHSSVRQDFVECLEEKRREEEYLRENG